jgi:very-short-patch-repair endonuclease
MASPTVLIAVVNRPQDLETILTKKWYRIPIKRMPSRKFDYIAFYQTAALGSRGGRIEYFARVSKRSLVTRIKLLPSEKEHSRANDEYYKFTFTRIQTLDNAIANQPGMRINFGFASLNRLKKARTLASLYGIRQVELVFRKLLARRRIPFVAEHVVRQGSRTRYRLDFAIFCRQGKIDVECDMRKFHSGARRLKDSRRDRFMKKHGWKVLRFSDEEILRNPDKCMHHLKATIKMLGGL